jgi:ABC-type lipoprotein export system ATPase subunit
MVIELGRIQFGDIDAKNEVTKQNRTGSSIFYKSFQVPPSVELANLLSGGQYFIRGQKGCGKTALLMHVEDILRETGAQTQIILFRTGVGETERANLANGRSIYTFFNDGKLRPEYDYTTNWLWFIYKNLLRLVDPAQVTQGREIVEDLRKLVGVHNEISRTWR